MPWVVTARELIPIPLGGGGDWGRHCSSSAWSEAKLAILFDPLHLCGQYSCTGSNHLISQVGWNRCKLIYLSIYLTQEAKRSDNSGHIWDAWPHPWLLSGSLSCMFGEMQQFCLVWSLAFLSSFLVHVCTRYMSGRYHLISKAGWNICNLLYSTPSVCDAPLGRIRFQCMWTLILPLVWLCVSVWLSRVHVDPLYFCR